MTIEIEKRIHPIFADYECLKSQGHEIREIVGKYQYIISSDKGQISIVELPSYFGDGITLWEIYCLKGNLFEDLERFDSYDEALAQCKKYLEI